MIRLALLSLTLASTAAAGEPERPAPLTFEQLRALARVHDPRVASAQAEVSKMRGLQSEADAARWPSITAFAIGGAPVPEATLTNPDDINSVTDVSRLGNWKLGNWGFLFHVDATIVQPLYTFGKIDNYRAAARAGAEAMQQLVLAAQDQAERDAAEVFWGFQLARELLKGLDEAMEQLADARKKVEGLLAEKSSQVSRSDLDKLDLLRAELKGRRGEAVSGRELALQAARTLAGAAPEAPFALAEVELPDPPADLKPVERFLDAARAHRPELAAAAKAVKARELLVDEKHSEFFPDLLVAASVSSNWSNAATRPTNPFAYDPYNGKTAGLGLGLRWTFDLPQKLAKLEQAQADLEKAKADELMASSGVRLQIYQAYGALKASLDRAATMDEQKTAARRWFTSAMLGFDSGMGETQEVLLAALMLARAEAETLALKREVRIRMGDLSRAVGVDAGAVQ
jgi:outer membrane protein TolC